MGASCSTSSHGDAWPPVGEQQRKHQASRRCNNKHKRGNGGSTKKATKKTQAKKSKGADQHPGHSKLRGNKNKAAGRGSNEKPQNRHQQRPASAKRRCRSTSRIGPLAAADTSDARHTKAVTAAADVHNVHNDVDDPKATAVAHNNSAKTRPKAAANATPSDAVVAAGSGVGNSLAGSKQQQHDENTIAVPASTPTGARKTRDVILVFGGPGSNKGRFVDELGHRFGTEVLSLESLVTEHLRQQQQALATEPKNAACDCTPPTDDQHDGKGECDSCIAAANHSNEQNAHQTLRQVHARIQTDREIVTMSLALSLLVEAMDRSHGTSFIVDAVPNHKLLLHGSDLLKGGRKLLAAFDRGECRIRFALCFRGKTVEVPGGIKQKRDEASPESRHRRSVLNGTAAEPLQSLFELSQRVVSVDLTAAATPAVVTDKLHTFMNDRQFDRSDTSSHVIFLHDGKHANLLQELGFESIEEQNVSPLTLGEALVSVASSLQQAGSATRMAYNIVRSRLTAPEHGQLLKVGTATLYDPER